MHPNNHLSIFSVSFAVFIAIVLIIGGFVVFVIGSSPLVRDTHELTRVSVAGTTIFAQVADTPELRARGLSGTKELKKGQGMLFLFSKDGDYSIWMKDMTYAIDILWISENGMILHTKKNVTPKTYPKIFKSPIPSRSILELPAGFVDDHNVEVGERVIIFG